MNDVDVAIVGAGPTGLALAGELALAGVSCAVFERRAEEPNLTRAFARARPHAGAAGRARPRRPAPPARPPRAERVARAGRVASTSGSCPAATRMLLIVPQSGTELLLEERARELGVPDPPRRARSSA